MRVAEVLKTAGYTTGHFEKWHLNRDKGYQPGHKGNSGTQGFDVVLIIHKSGAGPESPLPDDPVHVKQIARAALEFIESNRSNPFFCYMPHNSIHRPEIASEAAIARFSAKRGADNGIEYGHWP